MLSAPIHMALFLMKCCQILFTGFVLDYVLSSLGLQGFEFDLILAACSCFNYNISDSLGLVLDAMLSALDLAPVAMMSALIAWLCFYRMLQVSCWS